ncbi:hypothetical protein D3C87_1732980 [compost metagenome]
MLPPDFGCVPVIVALIDDGVELHVEPAVEHGIDEVILFDEALDALELGDVGLGGHANEPACQCWLDERADLVDVANKVVVDRSDPGAAIGREHHEALATQHLQRFAHRIGRCAQPFGKVGDNEPFVWFQPTGKNVFANGFIERNGTLAGDVDLFQTQRG